MHADSLDYAIKRLNSPPMNISKVYLPLMNAWLHLERTTTVQNGGHKTLRRVRTVWELDSDGNNRVIAEWHPNSDRFHADFSKSILLRKASRRAGLTLDDLLSELENRAGYLKLLLEKGITSHREVAEAVRAYYRGQVKLVEALPKR